MALTKIKLNTGMVTGSLPDANIPNDITISGAQTGITSVGTLTSLTTSGDVNVTADGARFFVSSADYELVSIGRAGSSGSALDQGYLRMKSAGSNKIALHTAGDSYINGGSLGIGTASPDSLIHAKVTTNTSETIRIQNDDSLTTVGVSSDGYSFHTYQHSLYLASWDGSTWSTKARWDNNGNLGIGHLSPQFGLTLAEGDLDANSIGWESSGNVKRGSIRMNPADYMKFNIGGGDRLWIGNATDNWAMNLTGNSPYGMQITTTSDGSSSHDAFVIKRQPSGGSLTKVFEIFNNGALTTYGGGLATFAGSATFGSTVKFNNTTTEYGDKAMEMVKNGTTSSNGLAVSFDITLKSPSTLWTSVVVELLITTMGNSHPTASSLYLVEIEHHSTGGMSIATPVYIGGTGSQTITTSNPSTNVAQIRIFGQGGSTSNVGAICRVVSGVTGISSIA